MNITPILQQGEHPETNLMRAERYRHTAAGREPKVPINCRWCGCTSYHPLADVTAGRVNSVFHNCGSQACKSKESAEFI